MGNSYFVLSATAALLSLLALRAFLLRRDALKVNTAHPAQAQLKAPVESHLQTHLRHLTSRISLLAAEGYGLHGPASDALNGTQAPAPFGVLAEAWIDFVCALEPQDDLWMVKIPQGETIAHQGIPLADDAHGFAIVRQGRVVHEFFYQCRRGHHG
jgi:hypothetical protein